MAHSQETPFGTAPKKLSLYIIGFILCSLLTLVAFGAVMLQWFTHRETLILIYCAAIIQFIVQVVCFLRLSFQTQHGRNAVLSLLFTGVILFTIVGGSLWIMWNMNHNMQMSAAPVLHANS